MCKRGCFDEISIWMGGLSRTDVRGHHPICWGYEWNKKVEGRRSLSFSTWLGIHPHLSKAVLVLRLSESTPGIYIIISLALKTTNYTTDFLGSPACKQQMVYLLSLHDHVSQYPIIDLFIDICYPFCFSGDLWLIACIDSIFIYFQTYTCLFSH